MLALEQHDLHMKSSEVSIKTRSIPASLTIQGQVTKDTTGKWSIGAVFPGSDLEAVMAARPEEPGFMK